MGFFVQLTDASRSLARSAMISRTRWADSASRKEVGSSSTSTGRLGWVLELIESLKQASNPEGLVDRIILNADQLGSRARQPLAE